MKASLTTREPEILKVWEETRVYEQIQKAREGAELFVLHDGPPFANGDVHMGTISAELRLGASLRLAFIGKSVFGRRSVSL